MLPKYVINLCCEISNMLNMKQKKLNINFDILQKVLQLDLIEDYNEDGIFVECKTEEYILNVVKSKKICESYVINKNSESLKSIDKIINESKDIYYYGDNCEFFKSKKFNMVKIKPITFNQKIILLRESKNINKESQMYINSIGMII